ncbi:MULTISPECIES: hypothetical protein [Campylobacter]|uniref:hypothetical protein n=1 Tax=Campylobacter TaxID=194 RepID=UPI000B401B9E|nr:MULTISPECIES: hypothetical protein [Campylobacter]MCR8677606.1 hypothetical protein [Campylobacter sp. S4:11]MCR8686276.1 hypothetical protein [Campylobacter sp. 1569]EAJ6150567.1 hypothetical protein [Campylobacter lari]EHZ4885250.1 hypothetical protein [Campylobacter lari]MBT0815579.1 hypothetical protein [Campylobacter lari]
MRYSLIKPKTKPIFNLFTRIWIYFTSISVALIFLLFIILVFKNYSTRLQLDNKKEELIQTITQINAGKIKYKELLRQNDKVELILGSLTKENREGKNKTLLKSIQNLFALVPKDISLDEVLMENNSLILRGITPSKEMFALLLETPLRSIFSSSQVSYYQLENGWYRFVSVNITIPEENL